MVAKTAAIIGFGPGLGTAYAEVFSKAGYDLALLSRSGSGADDANGPALNARVYACDASDPEALAVALDRVERDLGPIEVAIYNADIAQFGTIEEITVDQFERSWRVGTLGLFAAAKFLAPRMAERGSGTIIVSGATASLRGNLWTTAFAPTKASQRILAQSLAKQLGPRGIHVGYLVIDGVIDTADTRANFAPNEPDDFFLKPEKIAETALMLCGQDRSAWTFELDLRPYREKW
jgi:NAD(P)-dependent dehydrogenase (short-subunit alcohol dehydrogenase family)